MAVMISTSTFVNASFFDESKNSLRKPVFPQACFNCRRFVRLNSRKSKTKVMFCLNLNTKEAGLQSSGDGGFGFKPSFDQYLQIMESVKTARKQKKFDRLLKDKVEDDGGGGGVGNGDPELRNGFSDKRLEAGRDVNDVNTKSGDPKDEGFRRSYSRQEIVIGDKRSEKGFKRNEESGIQRIIKDVKWSKRGESSAPEAESFRKRYVKQEIVMGGKRNERGFKRNEESGIQRITKDVKWIKNDESSATAQEDDSFRRRNLKQEMVRHHHSSDTPRGIERSSGVVEEWRRITNVGKWSKSGESSSVIAPEDESFRGRYSKQELVKYQRSYDTARGTERSSKGDGLDLVAEERRIERLANERHDLRRSKLSGARRMGDKKDDGDDDSLFDMESPAFRFSDESSDVVDKPATSRQEMEDRIEKLAKLHQYA